MFITENKLKKMLQRILGIEPTTVPELIKEIKTLVGPKEEIPKLKKELAELKLQKTIEERDIKHLIKCKEEKLALEHKSKEVELQKQFQAKEMKMQTEYHDKTMKQIEDFRKELKETYAEIMKRLPNVNMEIKQTRRRT